MDRGICHLGQLLIGRSSHEHIGRLAADLEGVEIIVLQQLDMVEAGFHHRIRAGFAVFIQQMLFQRPGIHPDADRTAMVAGGLDHLAHPGRIADIAGVDPQTGGPGGSSLDRAFIVEMDVGHDRHRAFAAYFVQSGG